MKAKKKEADLDVFKLITLSLSEKKKIERITHLPKGHALLSTIREVTSDARVKYCTPFMWAVYKGAFKLAHCLMEHGADCHTPCYLITPNNSSVILVAKDTKSAKAGMREVSVLEMIVAKNGLLLLRYMHQKNQIGNINQVVNHAGQGMVHIAAKYGHCEMMDLLVELGADINLEDPQKCRPIVSACETGNEKMVACLIRHKVNIVFTVDNLNFLTWFDVRSKDPMLSLRHVITFEEVRVNPESFQAIAKHLKAFAITDEDHLLQIIIHVEKHSFKEALLLLTKYTGNIDSFSHHHGRSLLHKVAQHVSDDSSEGYELAKAVLARKPKIDVPSEPGNTAEDPGFTPLHLACESGRAKMMVLLLTHHATIDCKTDSGMTPLHLAAMQGHTFIVKYLCHRYQQLGLSVDPFAKGTHTPLIFAVVSRQTEAVRILLSFGANPTQLSAQGGSVLLVAIDKRHGAFIPEILDLLVQSSLKLTTQIDDKTIISDHVQGVQKISQTDPVLEKPTPEIVADVSLPRGFTLASDMRFDFSHLQVEQGQYCHPKLILTIENIKKIRDESIRNFEELRWYSRHFIALGSAPLFFAILEECLPAIEILMKHEKYRSPIADYPCSIHVAFKMAFDLKKSRSLKVIIEQLRKRNGGTPFAIPLSSLVQAVALNETKIVRVLLDSNCIEDIDQNNFITMIVLLKFSSEPTLHELIRFGFDFDGERSVHPFSCVGFLIANKKFDLVRCLLERKCVAINKRARDSSTLLMQACFLEDHRLSVKFINLLLQHGADCQILHDNGLNVLHIAIILKNQLAAKVLIAHQPSLVTNGMITLSNNRRTTLAHLCMMSDAIWLLKHHQLLNEKTLMQRDSEGLLVRDIALQLNQLNVVTLIDEICKDKPVSTQAYEVDTKQENCSGRQFMLTVLGFTATEVRNLQNALKTKQSEERIISKEGALPAADRPTYFSGRFTLFNNSGNLRRAEGKIQLLADWRAIGEISEEESRSIREVLEKPKLVVTGVGVKYIGRHTIQIRFSDDATYSEYPCCYEVKISSKARLLCVQVNSDDLNGPLLLVACHYMPRGLHSQRDVKRLDEVIQKTLYLFDQTNVVEMSATATSHIM